MRAHAAPTKQCVTRLQREHKKLQEEKEPLVTAAPNPNDITQWYYLVEGPEGTPYEGGRYLGQLKFPPDYPFKPPSIQMLTPNGRFETGKDICLSNSSFHPEQWSPMWGVGTILTGLVSFFVTDEVTSGSIQESDEVRRDLARKSRRYNVEKLTYAYRNVMRESFEADAKVVKEAE